MQVVTQASSGVNHFIGHTKLHTKGTWNTCTTSLIKLWLKLKALTQMLDLSAIETHSQKIQELTSNFGEFNLERRQELRRANSRVDAISEELKKANLRVDALTKEKDSLCAEM